jgi:hypothetical protein
VASQSFAAQVTLSRTAINSGRDAGDWGPRRQTIPLDFLDRFAVRAIDDMRVDVECVEMLAWPSCSCAILTGTFRSFSSDE